MGINTFFGIDLFSAVETQYLKLESAIKKKKKLNARYAMRKVSRVTSGITEGALMSILGLS